MSNIPTKNYLATIDLFVTHWGLVNGQPGATALTLLGGYALANLTTDRTALATQMTAVEAASTNVMVASADRDIKRASVREKMRQFNSTVRGLLPGTVYPGILPEIPNLSAAPGLWTRAMDDMAFVWNRINTDTPAPAITLPLILTGPYTRANFLTDQTALLTAFTATSNTTTTAEAARDQRDVLFAAIYARLIQYRKAVQGRFPKTHALYQSLPILTPAPGSTPDPVNLSGNWDTATNLAHLAYTASLAPHLAEYQLRACFGGTRYNTANETVVATNPPAKLFFDTDEGLVAPGSVAYYKVYVLTTNGNEKGSKAIKVVRP